jgi:hypothetical protein
VRDFESIWSELKQIARDHLDSDQPILTLDRKTSNKVTKVTDTYVERDSVGKKTGGANRVRKSDFHRIYEALKNSGGEVQVQTIGTLYFAYALFNQLAEVTFSGTPLTLYWNLSFEKSYYVLGSKYGEHADVSVLEDMIHDSVVSTGFYDRSLADFYSSPELEIKNYLKEKGEEPKSYNALSKFLQLKPGDIVAVKTTGSPKGSTPSLIIDAFAIVVERDGIVYSYRPDVLGHCINVEFIDTGLNLEFEIGGYGRTIHKITEQQTIDLIFKNYHPKDEAIIRAKIKKRRRTETSSRPTGIEQRSGSKPYVASLKHNDIQLKFRDHLEKLHGKENVTLEKDHIDIKVDMGTYVVLYEVKRYDEAEHCIKEAIGQLISYGFFSEDKREKRFVIVGPSQLVPEELSFLKYLKDNFRVEIDYQAFPC